MMELVAQEVRLEAFRRVSEMSIVQHHHSTSTSTKKMGRNNKFDSIQTLVKKPNSNNDTIITTKGLASSPTVSKNAAAADDEEGSKRKSSPSKIEDLAMTVRLPKKAKVRYTKSKFLDPLRSLQKKSHLRLNRCSSFFRWLPSTLIVFLLFLFFSILLFLFS